MLERKDYIMNKVLEPIPFVLAYPTVLYFRNIFTELSALIFYPFKHAVSQTGNAGWFIAGFIRFLSLYSILHTKRIIPVMIRTITDYHSTE